MLAGSRQKRPVDVLSQPGPERPELSPPQQEQVTPGRLEGFILPLIPYDPEETPIKWVLKHISAKTHLNSNE